MSYSFLLVSGSTNNPPIPVGASYNGKIAVLHRKSSSLNSSAVANGRAVFSIPAERVLEFAGRYTVTIDGEEVQDGDINILRVPSTGGTPGGSTADLSNYFTKPEIISQISSKTDKSYVDAQLNLKANDADLKSIARSGNYTDLINKPDLTGFATTTALSNGLSTKVNTSTYTSGLAAKADAADVTAAIAAKADASALTAGLAGKADSSAVTSALAAKANTADVYTKAQVDATVGAKANATDVYTKAAADAKFALIGAGGGGGTGNLLVLGPTDPVPANTATGTVIVRKVS